MTIILVFENFFLCTLVQGGRGCPRKSVQVRTRVRGGLKSDDFGRTYFMMVPKINGDRGHVWCDFCKISAILTQPFVRKISQI